jgi:hypothetical protein
MKAEVRAELYEKKIEKQAEYIKYLREGFWDTFIIAKFESELSAIDKQIKEAENTPVGQIKESLSNEILWRVANDWFIGQIQPGKGCFELSREEIISLLVDFTKAIPKREN